MPRILQHTRALPGSGPSRLPGGGTPGSELQLRPDRSQGNPKHPGSLLRWAVLPSDLSPLTSHPPFPSLPRVLAGHRSAPPIAVVRPPGRGDQEALTHAQQPVQAVAGAADAHPGRLPALLRALHQAQRVQEAHGERPWRGPAWSQPGGGGAGGGGAGLWGAGWGLGDVGLRLREAGEGACGCRAQILTGRPCPPGALDVLFTSCSS